MIPAAPTLPAVQPKPLPAADLHLPVQYPNNTGKGRILALGGCSCGWTPKTPSQRTSTLWNSHAAHRRKQGLPSFADAAPVSSEGPYAGWTWDEYYPTVADLPWENHPRWIPVPTVLSPEMTA